MRIRIGNPHDEAHDRPMRCYDWIAPPGTTPQQALERIEAARPGLKLYYRGDGEVHGFVSTSRRPDGSLYICVGLYDADCVDPACPAGHRDIDGRVIAHRRAPALTPAQCETIVQAVGEHASHRLTGAAAADRQLLRSLGFNDGDAPLA